MDKKGFILIGYILIFTISLTGQCPDRDELWRRLLYLRETYVDHSKLPPKDELNALLDYLEKIKNCSYRNDSTHVTLARVIAGIYMLKGDFLKSTEYNQLAIDIIRKNVGKQSMPLTKLPACYYWLSVAYDSLNNFTQKMTALDSCFTVSIRLKYQDRSTLTALQAWTQYFFDVGDYQKCIDYSIIWESLAKKYANNNTGMEHHVGEISAQSALGWRVKAMLQLKNFESANELLDNKLAEYRKQGRKDYLGMVYGQLGLVSELKGYYGQALSNYLQCLKYYQDTADNFNCKQTAKDIGNLYLKHINDPDKARDFYKKALTFINKDKSKNTADVFESLSVFGGMANAYVQNGNYDSAFTCFQLAYDQIKPGANENEILHISPEVFITYNKIHYLTTLQIDKGDAFQKLYMSIRRKDLLDRSIAVYKKTDQLLDRIKGEQSEIESKLFWRSDSRRLYEHAIEACHLSNNIQDAFYFFEKSRAVLLQDQLNEQQWLGEKDIMKQTQLNKKILQLEREIKGSDKSSKQYSELQDELFTTKQEFENIKALIKTNNPLYYQNFMNTDSITVKDVQQKILNDHQALVELFDGDSAVYVLAITNQRSYLQKINKTAFESLFNAYIRYLSDQDLLNRDFYSFTDISNQLYQVIFRKINLPAGRIIISPDGRYFPFESLVTKKQPVSYFLENYAVSYTYSARYLLNNFLGNSNVKSRNFFGIAPVRYTNGRLAALSGSDQSLQRMQTYFRNPTSFVGAKATKNNFLTEYYRYKIVQLYTHATDSSASGDPAIYFADSTLLLSDLFYENKPASRLIVLSACETAKGELYNGEGVFSFNRQFAALGIPSCVSTLWQADDQSTYRITELFYKYLAKGLPLDVALQSAKKEFRQSSSNEHKLPYYWAAPILVGQSGTIELPSRFPWRWVIALGILVLIGIGGWQVRKRSLQKNKKLTGLSLQS